MPTVLRVSGPYTQLQSALHSVSLHFAESVASQKSREQVTESNNFRSTFNLTVSEADGDQMPQQILEAGNFLSFYGDEIEKLRRLSGVEDLRLDFSWDFPPTSAGQFNLFPPSFLQQCASCGISIEISVYGCDG